MKAETQNVASELAAIVGPTHTSTQAKDLESYGDLEPDVVAWPANGGEIAAVFKAATALQARVAVAGSGSRANQNWPAREARVRIAVDTRRMTNILELDEHALLVHSQAGILLAHLEQVLARNGLTLGPYPPWLMRSTMGGVLADPPPEAYTPLTGAFSDGCIAVSAALGGGTLISTPQIPRSAIGPDVRQVMLGSRGRLGVIEAAWLRVYRRTGRGRFHALRFDDAAAAIRFVRSVLQAGVKPAELRLVLQTGEALRTPTSSTRPHVLIKNLGDADVLDATEHQVARLAEFEGGVRASKEFARRFLGHLERPGVRHCLTRRSGRLSLGDLLDHADGCGNGTVLIDQFDHNRAHLWLIADDADSPPDAALYVPTDAEPAGELTASAVRTRLRQQLDPSAVVLCRGRFTP